MFSSNFFGNCTWQYTYKGSLIYGQLLPVCFLFWITDEVDEWRYVDPHLWTTLSEAWFYYMWNPNRHISNTEASVHQCVIGNNHFLNCSWFLTVSVYLLNSVCHRISWFVSSSGWLYRNSEKVYYVIAWILKSVILNVIYCNSQNLVSVHYFVLDIF